MLKQLSPTDYARYLKPSRQDVSADGSFVNAEFLCGFRHRHIHANSIRQRKGYVHVRGAGRRSRQRRIGAVDVAILAVAGYTRQTWTAKRPWPGGRWYAGGRGPRDAGMSLSELEEGVAELGGFKAPLVVIDAGAAKAIRAPLRRLVAETNTIAAIKVGGRSRARELADLAELIHRVDLERGDLTKAVTDQASYRGI
ncbi:hypothetical protein [Nocardioides sp. InS609-2]|uniref:hypothetical protein n=1 Tax=Nocardioides sp. InS609-2 TaxID=2760705 RepID=UPI0020C0767E|nr:hypothetical protein [Nocardioides sp. InS609-2]